MKSSFIVSFLVLLILFSSSCYSDGYDWVRPYNTFEQITLNDSTIYDWNDITTIFNQTIINQTIINASLVVTEELIVNGSSITSIVKNREYYDIIIDITGNGDYIDIPTAISSEPAYFTFFIKNGTYTLTADIQMKEGQQIIGESMYGVIIDQNLTTNRIELYYDDNVVLKKFSFINGRDLSEQLDVYYSDNVILEEIYMESGRGGGGLPSYVSGLMVQSSDNTYINNLIIKDYLYNYKIESSTKTRMSNVYSENAQAYGYRFRSSSYSAVNNIISYDDYSAVYFRDSNYGVFTNVIVEGALYGFYFYAPSTHNTIANFQGTALQFAFFRGLGHDYNTFIGVDLNVPFTITSNYTKLVGCSIEDITINAGATGSIITGSSFATLTDNGEGTSISGSSYDNAENIIGQQGNVTLGNGISLDSVMIESWNDIINMWNYTKYFDHELNISSNVVFESVNSTNNMNVGDDLIVYDDIVSSSGNIEANLGKISSNQLDINSGTLTANIVANKVGVASPATTRNALTVNGMVDSTDWLVTGSSAFSAPAGSYMRGYYYTGADVGRMYAINGITYKGMAFGTWNGGSPPLMLTDDAKLGVGAPYNNVNHKLELVDNSDSLGFGHSTTDAYFNTSDGGFNFYGGQRDDNFINIQAQTGKQSILYMGIKDVTIKANATNLDIEKDGILETSFFKDSTDGITQKINIYGFVNHDALRKMTIQLDPSTPHQVLFTGMKTYDFDNSLITQGTLTVGDRGVFGQGIVSNENSGSTSSYDTRFESGANANAFLLDASAETITHNIKTYVTNIEVSGSLNVTHAFTGSCINVTYLNGIAMSCND